MTQDAPVQGHLHLSPRFPHPHSGEMGCGESDHHSPGWALSAEPFVLPVGTLGAEGEVAWSPVTVGSVPCGSSCLLASRRGWDRHSWVKPGPSLSVLLVWEGRFREEPLAFQVVVQSCGLVYRPPAIWPARAPKEVEKREGKEEEREEEGTGRRHRGPPGWLARRPRPSTLPRQLPLPPASPSLWPVGGQGPRPARGSLARSERPCLWPRRRWHGDSSQVCKLVPLSPGRGEPWRLANMTQENVC